MPFTKVSGFFIENFGSVIWVWIIILNYSIDKFNSKVLYIFSVLHSKIALISKYYEIVDNYNIVTIYVGK